MFHLSLFQKVFIASPVRVLPSVGASIASKAAEGNRQFAFRDLVVTFQRAEQE
jgi:hypothetical protein